MVVFEGADRRTTAAQNEHAHASDWFSPFNISQEGYVEWAIEQDIILERHTTTSNYLFLDAHVEAIGDAQIRNWANEPFNFAKPQ